MGMIGLGFALFSLLFAIYALVKAQIAYRRALQANEAIKERHEQLNKFMGGE